MKNVKRISMPSAVVILAVVVGGCQFDGGPIITGNIGTELNDSSELSVRVRQALRKAPQTAIINIMVTKVGDDTVKLSGFVQNDATAYEAERVAGQVSGVRHVFNELVVE